MSKTFVGVDGCKGVSNCRTSWFAIALTDDGDYTAEYFDSISALWNRYKNASKILIDIPIGLRDSGDEERKCDKEARAKLKAPRASSVFPAPCRTAIYKEASYKKTSKVNKQVTGKGLTKQSFAIIPKIRDVDDFLRNNKRTISRISETHPEICFWALSGHPMEHSKKRSDGQKERMKVLESVYPRASESFAYAISAYRRKYVAVDDIIDALAAAVTAMLGEKTGLKGFPKNLKRTHKACQCRCYIIFIKSR